MSVSAHSVAARNHARAVPLEPSDPQTGARVHLAAMREHDRKAALLHWADGRWHETPDWRLDRQVIRLGLFLRERVGLAAGERVAILSPLRREWLVAEWAVTVRGAVAVAVDPELPEPELRAALGQVAPRVAFVAGPAAFERLERVRDAVPALEAVVAFEGPLPSERFALLSDGLDLGGTLDTPERAQAFRAEEREVSPDSCALAQAERLADGSIDVRYMNHRELTGRLKALWSKEPARKGDVAYLAAGPVTLGARLALLAFAGDGFTTTAFGTPGREVVEISELRPHKIVAAPSVLQGAVASVAARPNGNARMPGWLATMARLAGRARGRPDGRREISGALGGRARWLHATAAPGAALSERLRDVVTIALDV